MTAVGDVLATLEQVAALPHGSVVSWCTDPGDIGSESIGIVERDSLGDFEVTLAHTRSDYWTTMLEDLHPIPCTVIRVGR